MSSPAILGYTGTNICEFAFITEMDVLSTWFNFRLHIFSNICWAVRLQ